MIEIGHKISKKGDILSSTTGKIIFLVIFLLIMISIFGQYWPLLIQKMKDVGIIGFFGGEEEKTEEKPGIELTEEGKDAKTAFRLMADSIKRCRDNYKDTLCRCPLDVPMFNSKYIIRFEDFKEGFAASIYEADKSRRLAPKKAVIDSELFDGMQLCLSKDLTKASKEGETDPSKLRPRNIGYVRTLYFNMFRENGALYVYKSISYEPDKEYLALGTPEQAGSTTSFQLYRFNKDAICFFINRDGDKDGLFSGHNEEDTKFYREQIERIPVCGEGE